MPASLGEVTKTHESRTIVSNEDLFEVVPGPFLDYQYSLSFQSNVEANEEVRPIQMKVLIARELERNFGAKEIKSYLQANITFQIKTENPRKMFHDIANFLKEPLPGGTSLLFNLVLVGVIENTQYMHILGDRRMNDRFTTSLSLER